MKTPIKFSPVLFASLVVLTNCGQEDINSRVQDSSISSSRELDSKECPKDRKINVTDPADSEIINKLLEAGCLKIETAKEGSICVVPN